MAKLLEENYPEFYRPYIEALDENLDLIGHLEASLLQFEQMLYKVERDKHEYRYQLGKWTIKEIVQHLTDVERVFVYRALRFSRKDNTDLSGFDENAYVSNYNSNKRNYLSLLDEFSALRKATILMFQDFSDAELNMKGTIDGNAISVRALGFICSGHLVHHLEVISTRYLLE